MKRHNDSQQLIQMKTIDCGDSTDHYHYDREHGGVGYMVIRGK